jgi:death on curing protein
MKSGRAQIREWRWISQEVMLAVHDAQLAEHGGDSGVSDMALFDATLARPQQVAASGEATAAQLAASYGFGIVRERPFLMGNERTAFIVAELFLQLNGLRLTEDNANCVLLMRDVAAGRISEEQFSDWIKEHLAPLVAQ